jgi:hypothetical protein
MKLVTFEIASPLGRLRRAGALTASGSAVDLIYGGGPMYVEHLLRALELWGPIWIAGGGPPASTTKEVE